MEGGCSASSPPEFSNAPAGSDGGASKFLVNLPSRGNFSSTVVSSNLGGTRVYICNHDTSPPDNSGSRAGNQGSRKRAAEKSLDGKAAGKRAMTSTQLDSSKDFQCLTVERLRALLRESGLPVTGRKDELIARLRGKKG